MGQTAAIPSSAKAQDGAWIGRSMERVEDAALLSGNGRFIDDLGVRPGTLYAAILRSPHAHADIQSIDTAAAMPIEPDPDVMLDDEGDVVVMWTSKPCRQRV